MTSLQKTKGTEEDAKRQKNECLVRETARACEIETAFPISQKPELSCSTRVLFVYIAGLF